MLHKWIAVQTAEIQSEFYEYQILASICPLLTQDFLIKLDIKPLMHLLKIGIFLLDKDIVRLTKIMNNLVKDCKIPTFKVIFQCLKLDESFQTFFSVKNI